MSETVVSGSPAPARRLRITTLARIAGLVALGLFFASQRELVQRTFASIGALSLVWYAIGLGLYVGGLLFSALRVRVFVRALERDVPYPRLVADCLKATGLNASIAMGAGEIYRVGRLRSEGLGMLEASAVVVADRSLGLGVIGGAGLLGLATFGRELTGYSMPVTHALLLASAALAGLLVAGRRVTARWLPSASPFLEDPRRVAALLACSGAVLALWIASLTAFARALGLDVGIATLSFAAPLVTLATLLPISIGGVGVREAGYALLLEPHGVLPNEAVALGLVQYSGFLFVASIAWLAFAFERSSGRSRCQVAETGDAGGLGRNRER